MAKKRVNRNNRESGNPGGGAGRRDDVKGSPVWPGTGPFPPGEAEVRTGGQFGTDDYNESGTSEIFYYPSELEKDEKKKPKGKK